MTNMRLVVIEFEILGGINTRLEAIVSHVHRKKPGRMLITAPYSIVEEEFPVSSIVKNTRIMIIL